MAIPKHDDIRIPAIELLSKIKELTGLYYLVITEKTRSWRLIRS